MDYREILARQKTVRANLQRKNKNSYLPIFSIKPSPTMVYGAMVYFIVLNLLALLVSTKMKWKICISIFQ
ncbi:MAG: hypothetical protein FWE27_08230 [Defluviitaleaceae bacterium]|nr:hypothetical protein [Defluviitaleaceae bacterium]